MAEILPEMGYSEIFQKIDPQKSWRDEENLLPAMALIPEFLDGRNPNRSHFIHYPNVLLEVAATDFVGMAGVGMDAASYDEKDSDNAKKLGGATLTQLAAGIVTAVPILVSEQTQAWTLAASAGSDFTLSCPTGAKAVAGGYDNPSGDVQGPADTRSGIEVRHTLSSFDHREAGDRELAVIVDEAAAGGGKLRAAEAGDADPRIEGEELAGQRSGIEIAGRFAAGQQEARAQDAGRLNSAGSRGALIFTSVTRRSTDIGPTFCVARKANWMPLTSR